MIIPIVSLTFLLFFYNFNFTYSYYIIAPPPEPIKDDNAAFILQQSWHYPGVPVAVLPLTLLSGLPDPRHQLGRRRAPFAPMLCQPGSVQRGKGKSPGLRRLPIPKLGTGRGFDSESSSECSLIQLLRRLLKTWK